MAAHGGGELVVGILLRLPAAADISQAQLVLFEASLTEPSLAGFGAAMEIRGASRWQNKKAPVLTLT